MKASQKIAIVTAASKGIGAACAEKLFQKGYKLVLMSRSDGLYSVADRLEARPLKGSVTQPADLDRLIDFTLEKYGRIDAVVFNTGHAPKGQLLSLTDQEWLSGMDLLLLPIIRMARKIIPSMCAQGQGSIVAISSFAARIPQAQFAISSVFRAALGSYVKLLSQTYAPMGIQANVVLPGYIDTSGENPEIAKDIPMKRYGTPDEIAGLVAFLLSSEGRYINGQSIAVDGGLIPTV